MKKARNMIVRWVVLLIIAGLILVPFATAANGVDSEALRDEVSATGIIEHLAEWELLGPRPSGTGAYDMAGKYVVEKLLDAGYLVRKQSFTFDYWEELYDAVLDSYPVNDPEGFASMSYSGAGDVTAKVAVADNCGCDESDFTTQDFNGKIAVIMRGICYFSTKAINAEAAGAIGVVVYNDKERWDAFYGTLGDYVVDIPVVGSSYAIGQALIEQVNGAEVNLAVYSEMHADVPTYNVIAETPTGRGDRVVVVGAHLDSAPEGPGINDNGSGSAAILEIALKMAELGIEPENKIRFAWWGAEEVGLLGSQYYVDNLPERELKNISLNLNFDMLASSNYVRFVYDGDGSDTGTAGPNGSSNIESVFLNYFSDQGLNVEPTEFDGRSDYGPFIDAGIPAGGLFTGADEIKTEDQESIYGGQAGKALDSFYHTAEDTLININDEVLEVMADAAAHAIQTFAMTKSGVNGTDKGKGLGKVGMKYKGPRLQQ